MPRDPPDVLADFLQQAQAKDGVTRAPLLTPARAVRRGEVEDLAAGTSTALAAAPIHAQAV